MKRLLLSALLLASLAIPASAQQLQCMFTTAPTTEGTADVSSDNYGIGLIGIEIPQSCTTSNVAYNVIDLDRSGSTYDLGLYCQSGTCTPGKLYVHTGPLSGNVFTPTTGSVVQSWTSRNVSLPAGVYAVGVGTSCSGTSGCAEISGDSDTGTILPFFVSKGGTYSRGLPSQVKPPQINPVAGNTTMKMPTLLIY
jgi:hypothetical protein